MLDFRAKSKILLHFMKGQISLTPMVTIMMIHGELECIEGLVKLMRKKKDEEIGRNYVATVNNTPDVRRISINITYRSKTMHFLMEINNGVIKGLVDTGTSMSVMAANIIQELWIMHLVSKHETYKTTSKIVTTALGRLDDIPVHVGNVVCNMVFFCGGYRYI
jgi:predicted aspartyl protease